MIELITPSYYLQMYKRNQCAVPCESSWGNGGYHQVWLDYKNNWIYRHLHEATERMVEISMSYSHADDLLKQALNQCARELMLAQSSDWAFIMYTGTMVEYAVMRTKFHINNFFKLYDAIKGNNIDEVFLSKLESTNNIFPNIDYRVFCTQNI